MAKKKGQKPGPKPTPLGPRNRLLAIKCREDYKNWVVELADEYRMTPSQVVDAALVEFAKTRGFKNPPKR